MGNEKMLESIVKRCQGEFYIGVVGMDSLIVKNGFRK